MEDYLLIYLRSGFENSSTSHTTIKPAENVAVEHATDAVEEEV